MVPPLEHRTNSCPVPKGTLLVIGGHEDKNSSQGSGREKQLPEILGRLSKTSSDRHESIEVVTSASSYGKASFKSYQKLLADLGFKHIGHIHHDRRAAVLEKTDCLDRVKQADAVLFAGGDQLKLTTIYGGTELLGVPKQRYIDEPVVIAGTSAGAMALSTPMIYAGNKDEQQTTGEIKVTTGLEFLKDVCIDTHFVDRSRFVRMAQVVTSNPSCIGIGIEENTALLVTNGVESEVIGDGVIIIIEGFGITDSNMLEFDTERKVFIENLNVTILARGNRYRIPQMNPPHI